VGNLEPSFQWLCQESEEFPEANDAWGYRQNRQDRKPQPRRELQPQTNRHGEFALCSCSLPRYRVVFFLAVAFSTFTAQAAQLNDTGQTDCYTAADAVDGVPASDPTSAAADAGDRPRQDCRYGRDAAIAVGAATKAGSGAAGFDFTALDASGTETSFSTGATPHACVHDNVTGLTWEVKTDDAGLRDKDHTYTWYSDTLRGDGVTDGRDGTANELNGGTAGTENGGTCFNKYDASTNSAGNYCDTAGYVAAVNAAGLCGYSDWRLPSREELRSIAHYGASNPAIDTAAFPNTNSSNYWSASTFVPDPAGAWSVFFGNGNDYAYTKPNDDYVRLVRGGQ
jgi:hypothetical protein